MADEALTNLARAEDSECPFAEATTKFKAVIEANDDTLGEDAAKLKEKAVVGLSTLYAKEGKASALVDLLKSLRTFFGGISKAKTAKLVRSLLDKLAEVPDSLPLQVEAARDAVEWATESKRMFLRQRVESKLCELLFLTGAHQESLKLCAKLHKELKKLDEKMLLLEVQLVESMVHHALRNIPRAKASLTSARSIATSVYCPPLLQATIDLQAGIIQAEENDYKTAYSYFFESFESFANLENPKAIMALKYMLLCKIMLEKPEEVSAILNNKLTIKYTNKNRDVDAMKAVAAAGSKRSLEQFQQAEKDFEKELGSDAVIKGHLAKLYESILDQNLTRIIEPYSCVEIAHVAKVIELDIQMVEDRLSKMILDGKLVGILDQGAGTLVVFDEPAADKTYPAALEVVANMSKVVDSLYAKKIVSGGK